MYNSFLICNHEKIICFYQNGLEVAIYDKESKTLKIKEGADDKLKESFNEYLSAAEILQEKNGENLKKI